MNVRIEPSRTPARRLVPSGRKIVTVCAAIGAFSVAGAARADDLNLTFAGHGAGQTVQASLGNQSWNVFAGRLLHNTSGGTGALASAPVGITTFCVDILQAHATGPTMYNSSSVALLSGNTGLTNLGGGKQQAIYDLYQAADNLQFTAFSGFAAAFQIAVWEVVYDYSTTLPNHGLSVTGGNFRASAPGQSGLSAALAAKVQMLLGHVGTGATAGGLMGLRSGSFQDQLFVGQTPLVPVPHAVWVGLSGLGLAAGLQWRRRHEQNRNLWDGEATRRTV